MSSRAFYCLGRGDPAPLHVEWGLLRKFNCLNLATFILKIYVKPLDSMVRLQRSDAAYRGPFLDIIYNERLHMLFFSSFMLTGIWGECPVRV
jgi:hypothetical protein